VIDERGTPNLALAGLRHDVRIVREVLVFPEGLPI
jgi:hypothetical protein